MNELSKSHSASASGPFLDDLLVAPLLLQTLAQDLRDRDHNHQSAVDCFTLLDVYVSRALDNPAAANHDVGFSEIKRWGSRLSQGAAIWTRRELREQFDICGPNHRSRMRLRHFGCPSTFHLKELAVAGRALAATLAVEIADPFAVERLLDLSPKSPAEALLRAACAQQGGNLSSVEQLVSWTARAVMTPERAAQVIDDERAEKARALVRKKIRAALSEHRHSVSLNSSHLTAAGNSQVAACVNSGLAVWRAFDRDPEERLSTAELLRSLTHLAVDGSALLCDDFGSELRKRQLLRHRPSALAERMAA